MPVTYYLDEIQSIDGKPLASDEVEKVEEVEEKKMKIETGKIANLFRFENIKKLLLKLDHRRL